MPHSHFSRRDFLKLAALGLLGVAGQPLVKGRQTPGQRLTQQQRGQAVLSPTQQYRLYQASLAFLAPTQLEAVEVALAIDFIEGRNEDPSNMCGPLSIRILKDAGLLGAWAQVNDFWLLDPDMHMTLIEDTFPPHLYERFDFERPFSQHDFTEFPLQAGDLFYLFAGPSDTFEHIFIVTRVDATGRAYTVSNFLTDEGMLIAERMLYDPQRPGVGQVYEWANRSIRNTIGITGGGGYSIWRVKDARSLEFPDDWASVQLRDSLNALFLNSSGKWFTWIEEIGGDLLFQFNPFERFHPASTIKLPIALAFYAWLDEQNVDDFEDFLQESGSGGRNFAQLLEAMIVDSEEEATQILTDFLGNSRIQARWAAWGLEDSQVFPRRASSRELHDSFLALYNGDWISTRSRAHLLDLMQSYTVNDDGRLGLLKARLPADATIYNKRGSLTSGPMVVADSGIIEIGNKAYFFSAHVHGDVDSGYGRLERELDQAIRIFGAYLVANLGGPRQFFDLPA